MTMQPARSATSTAIDEASVAEYLERHPEFFERHSSVLGRLKLPHVRGAAVSLIERQIEVLRERHAAMETKLSDFIGVARANDQLSEKIHRFTRRLLRAGSLPQVLDVIEASLREDFDAFNSRLVLIGAEPSLSAAVGEQFLKVAERDEPMLKSFDTLFASGKPRCGQMRDSQRDYLFSADSAVGIASVALVPLGEHGSLGLLAIGSANPDRFHPGMSTEFLGRMAELITDVIQRHL